MSDKRTKAELRAEIGDLQFKVENMRRGIRAYRALYMAESALRRALTIEVRRIASPWWTGAEVRHPTKWAQKVAQEAIKRYGRNT